MEATPVVYLAHEPVPKGTYALIDDSGEALNVAVRCEEGEALPELAIAGSHPFGYVRVGAESA